ncbi:hypothetical protein CAPTEDRAFT_205437 [Capitella teleta]|uniref:Uncharacterized protein n=1 Tax=Capitella teleta TaxID=283909 RepID=R7U180_CAPTE|nr:hypothetical protein CAPTEDRAFT_205437 [Capitella teleta]|eukprot:ELT97396.1 hypothetical protein CAPTEDRAFT_205437 [Capitella teleta]
MSGIAMKFDYKFPVYLKSCANDNEYGLFQTTEQLIYLMRHSFSIMHIMNASEHFLIEHCSLREYRPHGVRGRSVWTLAMILCEEIDTISGGDSNRMPFNMYENMFTGDEQQQDEDADAPDTPPPVEDREQKSSNGVLLMVAKSVALFSVYLGLSSIILVFCMQSYMCDTPYTQ